MRIFVLILSLFIFSVIFSVKLGLFEHLFLSHFTQKFHKRMEVFTWISLKSLRLRKLLHCRIWKLKLSYHTQNDDVLYLGYLRIGQPACTNWFLFVISKVILHIHLQFFFVNICCWLLNFNMGKINYIVIEGVNQSCFFSNTEKLEKP